MEELSSDEEDDDFYNPGDEDKMLLTVHDNGVGIGHED